jgi:hypothetical protein
MYVPETSWWQTAGDGQSAKDGHGFGDITASSSGASTCSSLPSGCPRSRRSSSSACPRATGSGPSVRRLSPGGFAPLGRLPSTHFGAPELTEAILFRKNAPPFPLSGGVYYSYGLPSSNSGVTQYYGDIFRYRLAFEQFLDASKGFGYAVELVGIHGLPFRRWQVHRCRANELRPHRPSADHRVQLHRSDRRGSGRAHHRGRLPGRGGRPPESIRLLLLEPRGHIVAR